ncbi:MAG: hypothetical protein DRQ55_05630 [Planctomycetota bacterium]|nr:MAG: hypothetical protein DRQ55_05630 [Planctomycetota bacterium]
MSALALGLGATGLSAQIPDFSVQTIDVNQAVQNGATTLVGEKTAIVRATVRLTNDPGTPVFVDGLMRVFVDGEEVDDSPVYTDNGPYQVLVSINEGELDQTMNFTFIPPTSNNVTLSVEVNPAGPNQVPEQTAANNITIKGPLTFIALGRPDMAYAPVDYRLGGGSSPNPPDTALIEPGVGDNFIQGVYPVPDWDYRRIDAPTKLWTSSLNGGGSALNNSLTADLNLMVPKPQYIYGWIPGSLPYNGQSIINGVASMGNTQPIRHQRTFAHEVGHCTGLFHHNGSTGLWGVDVEHHLAITQVLPKIKPPTAKDIMVAGLLSHQAWVYLPNYTGWMSHPKFQPGINAASAGSDEGETLFVAGIWNAVTGQVQMTDMLTLPSGRLSDTAGDGSEIIVRAFAQGQIVRELAVATVSSSDCSDASDSDESSPLVGFNVNLPVRSAAGVPIDQVVIVQGNGRALSSLMLERSANAPRVAFVSPAAAQLDGDVLRVAWEGSDADGDELTYYLRYSRDGVQFSPIHTSTQDTSFTVNMKQLPALVDGQGFFELFATDGLNTTVVRSELLINAPSFAGGGGNPPWAHILTPDAGATLLEGATVILHGMAWDLEDKGLHGARVAWSSDLDGALGTGRRTSRNDLSAGDHVVTLTVTDSDGMVSTDTAAVTIVARDLPDAGTKICQLDLGFGGPGNSTLSMCGGDLSSGTSADLLLTGAAPNASAWLVLSLSAAPMPFKGGTLVPIPVLAAQPHTTSVAGDVLLAGIPGGNGPMSFVLQFAIQDGAQPHGLDFSNAIQADFLP